MKNKVKYPKPKNEATTKSMRGNKSKGTKPELTLRKELWSAGIRGYRLHYNKIVGKPDVVFVGKKIAIFIHGCYWHRCPYCKLPHPKNNPEYWTIKFKKNKTRDKKVARLLKLSGWKVLVFWECKFKRNTSLVIKRILDEISTVN